VKKECNPGRLIYRAVYSLLATVFIPACAGGGVPPPLEATRPGIKIQASIDRDTVALSGEITLVLSVEGPERLEVTPPWAPEAAPPRWLLTPSSQSLWHVREGGFTVENLGDARQRWKQEFYLRPYGVGAQVELALAPIEVKAGNALKIVVPWPNSAGIQVTTEIRDASKEQIRSITDVETPESAPPNSSGRQHWIIVVTVAVGTALTLLAVVVLVRRGRIAEKTPDHDAAWTQRELDALAIQGAADPAAVARLAEVLRMFLEHRFNVPALHLTTAEVLGMIHQKNDIIFGDEQELRVILDYCDLAKFAGELADRSGPSKIAEWCGRAIRFVMNNEADAVPREAVSGR
jgi:hypothetical protein